MKINPDSFYAAFRSAIGPLAQDQVDGLNVILGSIETDNDLKSIQHVAYILATIERETGQTYRPIYEQGSRSYFDKYEPGTHLGRMLGNVAPGDGYLYRGRGYVQVTGRSNYHRLALAFNEPFVETPDLLLNPEWAWRAASFGMRTGLFTGRKLADYIASDGSRSDYYNARAIINPGEIHSSPSVVRAIARHAEAFDSILQASVATSGENNA